MRRKPTWTIAELRKVQPFNHLTSTWRQQSLMPLNFLFKESNKSPFRLKLISARFLLIATKCLFNTRTPHLERGEENALLVTSGIPGGMGSRIGILHFLQSAPSEHST